MELEGLRGVLPPCCSLDRAPPPPPALSCGEGADAGPQERAAQQGVCVCARMCMCVRVRVHGCDCGDLHVGAPWMLPAGQEEGVASGTTQGCPTRHPQAHASWSLPPPSPRPHWHAECLRPKGQAPGTPQRRGPPDPGSSSNQGPITETPERDRGLPGPEPEPRPVRPLPREPPGWSFPLQGAPGGLGSEHIGSRARGFPTLCQPLS